TFFDRSAGGTQSRFDINACGILPGAVGNPSVNTEARALLDGDRAAAARLARTVLKPAKTNFVERPWGGTRIREYEGLCPLPDQRRATGMGLGEAFEISAYDQDDEARRHPSIVPLADG